MDENSERMQILEMIDSGKISAAEGMQLLQALSHDGVSAETNVTISVEPVQPVEANTHPQAAPDPEPYETESAVLPEEGVAYSVPVDEPILTGEQPSPLKGDVFEGSPAIGAPQSIRKWRNWWMIPLWIGVGITVTGGVLMYGAMQSAPLGFWFLCAGVPFALGVVVMALAWQSRNAPWLHLRVQQRPGERPQHINFSFPIPVRPAAWFLRTFGTWIHGLQDTSLDEVILALGETTSPDNPVYIEVDEGEDGEKVEIYIG